MLINQLKDYQEYLEFKKMKQMGAWELPYYIIDVYYMLKKCYNFTNRNGDD